MENEPAFNPYAAPQSNLTNTAPTEVEVARRLLLKHEASVKSIGSLYLLGGAVILFSGFASLTLPISEWYIPAILIGLGCLEIWLALGLRRLKRAVRIPTMILSGLGLIGFPIGTIISAYILYLLGSQKGVQVFSDEYAQVIAATPHIKYRSSILAVILIIIFAVLIITVAATYLSRH
jgi:hypothetical protein